jgi:predicted nucleotidyltransferase component of viral defense system
MKHLTIESFINSLNEEDIWKIIDDYETYGCDFEAKFLREKAREYRDNYYYMELMPFIVIGAYRHFAMKYKESMKNE